MGTLGERLLDLDEAGLEAANEFIETGKQLPGLNIEDIQNLNGDQEQFSKVEAKFAKHRSAIDGLAEISIAMARDEASTDNLDALDWVHHAINFVIRAGMKKEGTRLYATAFPLRIKDADFQRELFEEATERIANRN